MNGKGVITAILTTFCMFALMFAVIPIRSGQPYDPWADYNDDGKIDMKDVGNVASRFSTLGTNLSKASLLYDSGWMNLSGLTANQYLLNYNLSSINTEVLVDVRETVMGWNRTYNSPRTYAYGKSIVHTSDGGYAIAGYTGFYGGDADFWLLKTDLNGIAEWNKTYGGPEGDFAYSLVQTSDGGYAMTGWTGASGQWHIWLVKTYADGNMQWNQTYGLGATTVAQSIIQTSDHGYAITGNTGSVSTGYYDGLLIKTDAEGNMQWNTTYSALGDYRPDSLVQTKDRGYAIGGSVRSLNTSDWDFCLIRTDTEGNALWSKTYGGIAGDGANSLVQTTDEGYALAGETSSSGAGESDYWLVKTDGNGNMVWNMTYGGAATDVAYSLVQTTDGGYTMVGTSYSSNVRGDCWLVKTDPNGDMQWNKTCIESSDYYQYIVYSLVLTNGGYAMAGYKDYFVGDTKKADFLLVSVGVECGLSWSDYTPNSITLYRHASDSHWNFVRVRIWKIR